MWGPKSGSSMWPLVTSGLSPRSMIPRVMAPGQSVDRTLAGRRCSWKNRLFPLDTPTFYSKKNGMRLGDKRMNAFQVSNDTSCTMCMWYCVIQSLRAHLLRSTS